MKKITDYITARDMLLDIAKPAGTENVPLAESSGRLLAFELVAEDNVPPFDKSPMDGYAVRSEDTVNASKENPVTLKILEEVPAGAVPEKQLTKGTATKILTGSPMPAGADAVIKYELTEFTDSEVTLFNEVKHSENVIYAGEDVVKGTKLASCGTVIDDGLIGTLSAQGKMKPLVYKRPAAAIISTGSELLEEDEEMRPGMIRNTSRYAVACTLERLGCTAEYLGTVKDDADRIAGLILKGLSEKDIVILTGGVSVGDYDLTPAAMEKAGVEILVRGVDLKPGMACCLGVKDGKPVCGLSGNAAAAMAVYFTICLPAIRKMAGYADPVPKEFDIEIENGFGKPSKGVRLLRGKLKFAGGKVKMEVPEGQGNVMISSTIGCDAAAIVPAGTGPIEPGAVMKGFLI